MIAVKRIVSDKKVVNRYVRSDRLIVIAQLYTTVAKCICKINIQMVAYG